MFKHSTTNISNDHVNHIVTSILNKKKRNIIEQQQNFIRRNSDETNKRNNYLLDKFTMKKQTKSEKENIKTPPKKKKPSIDDDDDDEDFISIKKRAKIINPPKIITSNPVKECLESIISEIENNEATCPICNEILSYLTTVDQRQQHVNHCLENSQINNVISNSILR